MPESVILAFPSTHMALRAERAATQAGIPARMIPAPRHLSTDCHMAMVVQAHSQELEVFLAKHRIEATAHAANQEIPL